LSELTHGPLVASKLGTGLLREASSSSEVSLTLTELGPLAATLHLSGKELGQALTTCEVLQVNTLRRDNLAEEVLELRHLHPLEVGLMRVETGLLRSLVLLGSWVLLVGLSLVCLVVSSLLLILLSSSSTEACLRHSGFWLSLALCGLGLVLDPVSGVSLLTSTLFGLVLIR